MTLPEGNVAGGDDEVSAEIARRVEPLLHRPGPRIRSDRPVDVTAIRNFCEAVQDANPVYWDDAAAAQSRFGRLIAPPQALMALNMWAWWMPPSARAGDVPKTPGAEARAILRTFGFDRVLFTKREEIYLQPFGPGDGHFIQQERLDAVSAVKRTAVGRGVFCTTTITFSVEATQAPVATATNVALIHERSGASR
jgi:uncharacterized protein